MSWRVVATLALILWGAVTFGAVYPWTYEPLLLGCAATGAVELLLHRRAASAELGLLAPLALVACAVGFQLVPLSSATVRLLSPATDAFLRRYAIGYETSAQTHQLSIEPRATVLALTAFVALVIFFVGSARALTSHDTRQIGRGVTMVGILLALTGIVQKAMWNGKIYGFWTPLQGGDSAFGPFVNRNHFAGWMLMALPLAIGYFCGRVTGALRSLKPGWRNRLLWLSSSDANQTILVGFSILVMATAHVLTLSRSGLLGLLLAAGVSGSFVLRRQSSRGRAVLTAACLLFVVVMAVGWAGFDRVALRFRPEEVAAFGGRADAWKDAWRIARAFPMTGTGMNTYGVATLYYQAIPALPHYVEAHNDYLQLLAEGGMLVCVPSAVALLTLAKTVRRRFREAATGTVDYWTRMGAVTGIVALAVQEVSDFSLQIPGNAVLFVVLLALAVRPSQETYDRLHD